MGRLFYVRLGLGFNAERSTVLVVVGVTGKVTPMGPANRIMVDELLHRSLIASEPTDGLVQFEHHFGEVGT